MVFISLFGLLLFLFLLLIYVKLQWEIAFLICAFLAPVTTFALGTNLGFVIFFLFSLPYILRKNSKYKFNNFAFLLFFFALLCCHIYLSLINDANIILNLLKTIQLFFVCYILFLLVNDNVRRGITNKEIKKIINSFVVINVSLGLVSMLFFDAYQLGMVRFSGIFFDANYFSLYGLLFFYVSVFYKLGSRYLIISLLMIISSLSATGIIFSFLFIILSWRGFVFFTKPTMIFVFVILLNVLYFVLINNFDYIINMHSDNEYIKYKIFSLSHRLTAQFLAIDLLNQDTLNWFIGFGSGRTIELAKLALHNFYIQSIFSHGIPFLFSLLVYYIYIFRICLKKTYNNRYLASIFCCYFGVGFLLDPFLLFFFHLVVLFTLFKDNKNEVIINNGNCWS